MLQPKDQGISSPASSKRGHQMDLDFVGGTALCREEGLSQAGAPSCGRPRGSSYTSQDERPAWTPSRMCMAHSRLLRLNEPGITQHRSSISTIPTITTAVRRYWWASHRIDAEAPQPPLWQAFRRPSGAEETCGSPSCVLGQLTVRSSAQSVVYPDDRSACRFRQGAGERAPSRPSARVPVPKRSITASISSPRGWAVRVLQAGRKRLRRGRGQCRECRRACTASRA